jgi:hypothetical protein
MLPGRRLVWSQLNCEIDETVEAGGLINRNPVMPSSSGSDFPPGPLPLPQLFVMTLRF